MLPNYTFNRLYRIFLIGVLSRQFLPLTHPPSSQSASFGLLPCRCFVNDFLGSDLLSLALPLWAETISMWGRHDMRQKGGKGKGRKEEIGGKEMIDLLVGVA